MSPTRFASWTHSVGGGNGGCAGSLMHGLEERRDEGNEGKDTKCHSAAAVAVSAESER